MLAIRATRRALVCRTRVSGPLSIAFTSIGCSDVCSTPWHQFALRQCVHCSVPFGQSWQSDLRRIAAGDDEARPAEGDPRRCVATAPSQAFSPSLRLIVGLAFGSGQTAATMSRRVRMAAYAGLRSRSASKRIASSSTMSRCAVTRMRSSEASNVSGVPR